MNERFKIGEARFFLAKMEESVGDREAFRYYLSAFLSAARSALQYALEESRTKRRQNWYDTTFGGYEVLRYFRDKRNVNIHGEPVNPSMDTSITPAPATCVITCYSPVVFISGDDPAATVQRNELPPTPTEEELPPPTPPENRSQTTVRYRFDDWPGPEDVIGLSHRYVEELEKFVERGIAESILSG